MKTCPRSVAPLMPLNETADTRPRPASVQRLIVRNGSADFEPGISVVKPPRGCDGSAAWSAICSAYSAAPCVRLPKPKAGLASWSRLRRPAQYWFFVSRATHSGVPGAGSPAGATQLMSTPNGGAAVAGAAPSAAAATHIPVKTVPRIRIPAETKAYRKTCGGRLRPRLSRLRIVASREPTVLHRSDGGRRARQDRDGAADGRHRGCRRRGTDVRGAR